jgi:hypothetical protein
MNDSHNTLWRAALGTSVMGVLGAAVCAMGMIKECEPYFSDFLR